MSFKVDINLPACGYCGKKVTSPYIQKNDRAFCSNYCYEIEKATNRYFSANVGISRVLASIRIELIILANRKEDRFDILQRIQCIINTAKNAGIIRYNNQRIGNLVDKVWEATRNDS